MNLLIRLAVCLGLCLAASTVFAQAAPAPLPEWDKLDAQQREALIAPLRSRWDSSPDERARMLDHARRWKAMTPEQRRMARKGLHRFENMSPEQRQNARALFTRMRDMSPEQRQQLREQWKSMSPEQRKAWMEKNAPRLGDKPPMPAPKN